MNNDNIDYFLLFDYLSLLNNVAKEKLQNKDDIMIVEDHIIQLKKYLELMYTKKED